MVGLRLKVELMDECSGILDRVKELLKFRDEARTSGSERRKRGVGRGRLNQSFTFRRAFFSEGQYETVRGCDEIPDAGVEAG